MKRACSFTSGRWVVIVLFHLSDVSSVSVKRYNPGRLFNPSGGGQRMVTTVSVRAAVPGLTTGGHRGAAMPVLRLVPSV